jgi:hypothetical protein
MDVAVTAIVVEGEGQGEEGGRDRKGERRLAHRAEKGGDEAG